MGFANVRKGKRRQCERRVKNELRVDGRKGQRHDGGMSEGENVGVVVVVVEDKERRSLESRWSRW